NNKIAICFIDGEFTVKRMKVEKDCLYLMPENPNYPLIKVTEENALIIWGIVTYVIKKL
ncbi:LexA family protein, partial [Flavobacterium sp. XS1P32]